jgi:hypothetical protein
MRNTIGNILLYIGVVLCLVGIVSTAVVYVADVVTVVFNGEGTFFNIFVTTLVAALRAFFYLFFMFLGLIWLGHIDIDDLKQ